MKGKLAISELGDVIKKLESLHSKSLILNEINRLVHLKNAVPLKRNFLNWDNMCEATEEELNKALKILRTVTQKQGTTLINSLEIDYGIKVLEYSFQSNDKNALLIEQEKKKALDNMEYWGVAEIAEYFNISKGAVSNWRKRYLNMPEATELAHGPVYKRKEIIMWIVNKFPRMSIFAGLHSVL